MASIYVYGYDERMLAAPQKVSYESSQKIGSRSEYHRISTGSTRCPLLEMPAEIRTSIYKYLLPTTIDIGGKGTAWVRGSTALLATNKRIYHEAIAMMYGSSTFLLDLRYDSLTFTYRYALRSAIILSSDLRFPDSIAARNLVLIRRYCVHIHFIDSYTGMIKYNIASLAGLAHGVKGQVARLTRSFQDSAEIEQLRIIFRDENRDNKTGGDVLSPLLSLRNIQSVSFSGMIDLKLRMRLERSLTSVQSN